MPGRRSTGVVNEKRLRWKNPELLEKILETAETPLDMTLEVLLWRGFMAFKHDGGLYLNVGSHEDDLEFLEKYLPVERLPDRPNYRERVRRGLAPDDRWPRYRRNAAYRREDEAFSYLTVRSDVMMDACCKVEPTGNKFTLGRILGSPIYPTGLIGPYDCIRGPGENMRFGRRVPVGILDPGVALLTKLMPLLRLQVWYSCEGHDSRSGPEISFSSAADLRLARAVLPQFLPPNDGFVREWKMEQGTSWSSYVWRPFTWGCDNDAESVYNKFKDVLRFCKSIINSHWDHFGNYRPYQSKAACARLLGGDKRRWEKRDCWDDPKEFVFSKEHAQNGFELPEFVETHPPKTIYRFRSARTYGPRDSLFLAS